MSIMRTNTQRRIDALHAEIDRLVKMELAWARKKEPELNEFQFQFVAARIECAAWAPRVREEARTTSTLRRPA